MNHDVPADDASILYYDGDYPSLEIGEPRAENVATLARIGILGDVGHYKDLARHTGGPVLEIGAGTGRLSVPLARLGLDVWAVDVAPAMLARLEARRAAEPEEVRRRLHPVRQDAQSLDLPERSFRLAIIPFNVLMLIPDLGMQRRTLASVAAHMPPGGLLALDIMNPLVLTLGEDHRPHPSEPRRNPVTGNSYVKTSLNDRMDEAQVQRLHGWYDELLPDGRIQVTEFSFRWRIIFRVELELLLNQAGFELETISGDFEGGPWTVDRPRMVATARRR